MLFLIDSINNTYVINKECLIIRIVKVFLGDNRIVMVK